MADPKEISKQTLLRLIDYCVMKGGIFAEAGAVAEAVNAVHVLAAPAEVGTAAMFARSAGQLSVADQLERRLQTNNTTDNGKE